MAFVGDSKSPQIVLRQIPEFNSEFWLLIPEFFLNKILPCIRVYKFCLITCIRRGSLDTHQR
ncbi:hypothetical protein A6770_29090 [Nostoc minutum NIES-26]|uniref:Uncharacterized protein n=1 Tax=Nostoc minutum NIES-26 TaxID=1844469 RepID=A0A367QFH5_9NOSO|nr:hypothetical protein A6770_29090 [Nostoc minutum NIES-26]